MTMPGEGLRERLDAWWELLRVRLWLLGRQCVVMGCDSPATHRLRGSPSGRRWRLCCYHLAMVQRVILHSDGGGDRAAIATPGYCGPGCRSDQALRMRDDETERMLRGLASRKSWLELME
jgi:hypothetical protein